VSLFSDVLAAGIPHASHESDLYLPDTQPVRDILVRHPEWLRNVERFQNQVEGACWIDIPFAYDPWWEART
jgi:hypothetical protein